MKITIVDSDDWELLSIDNKLVIEGHRVTVEDVLTAVGIKNSRVFADEEWLNECGQLPERLADVKRHKR